ncbi:hypothetical protein [Massilia antarctica]|uniref:hypothetical protein n=1 Tax=Massilia antarctica TaxID=2765360 RepID=UPI0006BD7F3E|nr:hypothetical protein [Massilia sp. H27-R4]MCY0911384.1 hypothetical protein [Massilia sp. H27-R4]CUI05012.1 hypothetical protein BN2497_4801 [Janthinobacterium sp. CG23_2]CUU28798.1 hypothetical protein BN3177_4801 [Janthinobacterium sp. CG23_2]
MRTHDRCFELVDDKGERDLFALSATSSNIARLVGQIDANGNRISIAYNQRQLPERVEDSAGRSHPRLRSIAMQPAEPVSDAELLVAYDVTVKSRLVINAFNK